jgi:hypothetical protein
MDLVEIVLQKYCFTFAEIVVVFSLFVISESRESTWIWTLIKQKSVSSLMKVDLFCMTFCTRCQF